jgi:hypothetical protein
MPEKRKRGSAEDDEELRGRDVARQDKLRNLVGDEVLLQAQHVTGNKRVQYPTHLPYRLLLTASLGLPSIKMNDPSRRRDKTFRVQRIPLGCSSKTHLAELLEKTLICSKEETGLICQSLAIDQTRKHCDATIIFEHTYPPRLQTESFPYSILIDTESIHPGYITIDEKFLGLTVLHSCAKNDHKLK